MSVFGRVENPNEDKDKDMYILAAKRMNVIILIHYIKLVQSSIIIYMRIYIIFIKLTHIYIYRGAGGIGPPPPPIQKYGGGGLSMFCTPMKYVIINCIYIY